LNPSYPWAPPPTKELALNDPLFNRITAKLDAILPPGLQGFREDIADSLKLIVQENLSKLDLVTREEFDIQKAVLEKANKRLKVLEKKVAQLEMQSSKDESA